MSAEQVTTGKHLVVIGGGASGFFCAIRAASLVPGLRVTIIEKQSQVLQKVKVSGGGRCNVTHACFRVSELVKNYPRGASFLKKSFRHFGPSDTVAWFESRGVALKTEEDGRMFPRSNQSQDIIDCLLNEASRYGVQVNTKSSVCELVPSGQLFEVRLEGGMILKADYVCIASGGFPKRSQYEWLQPFGLSIVDPKPSLFTFNIPDKHLHELMGLSVPRVLVKVEGSGLQASGPLLITHWGCSGPAILKLSSWGARELADYEYRFALIVNWLDTPEHQVRETWQVLRDTQGGAPMSQNPFGLPNRLWHFLLMNSEIEPDTRWSELSSKHQHKLIHNLCAQRLEVAGKTTFKEEFVTSGGIDLTEIDPHTMACRKVPGMFFTGEIMDVDALTGGFNFQHAWTSGFLAGSQIALMAQGME